MTLPTNITLPIPLTPEQTQDPYLLSEYLKKIIYVLSTTIEGTNYSINGAMTVYRPTAVNPYPFIRGSAVAGVGTYVNTSLFVRRINLMNFIWFDIEWTAHTGAGDVIVWLPYFSQNTNEFPYVGIVESDNNAFTAGYTYLTSNVDPNTNLLRINQNGSGLPILPLPLAATGHIRGTIIYAGQTSR